MSVTTLSLWGNRNVPINRKCNLWSLMGLWGTHDETRAVSIPDPRLVSLGVDVSVYDRVYDFSRICASSDNFITTNNMEVDVLENKFKGVNKFCKTCKKQCKQFSNVVVVYCPNRISITERIKDDDRK